MLYGISGLTRCYGQKTVLSIASLDIEEGQIYALLGPNGAGKSTFLDILGFLKAPTTGRIDFRGRPAAFGEAELQSFRQQVVVLDQHPILFTTTVYKNVEFGLKVRRVPTSERSRIVHEALELVGMGTFSHAQAHHLSGGETQRVALARALAVRPRVLLCDEPTASVDVENQEAIIRILQRINREHRLSIIFTTHDRLQAVRLAHKTLHLDHGRLAAKAPGNLFSGRLKGVQEGMAICQIQGEVVLYLPAEAAAGRAGAVRVLINPAKVQLEFPATAAPPANRLEGRVVRVAEENSWVRIVVDAGIWLDILIEAARYRENPPPVGETVGIVVPPEAIRLL